MTVFTRNGWKLIFYPSRRGLTRIDLVNSVLMGKKVVNMRKIYF
jgi:hypothetical protein